MTHSTCTRAALRRSLPYLLAGVVLVPFLALPVAGAGGPPKGGEQQVAVVEDDGSIDARVVSDEQLANLQAEGPGTVVTRGRTAHPQLAESVPKVGAPTFWGLGHRGAGRVIVVIDTGLDPGFGGTIVGQACFSATQNGNVLEGHCGEERDLIEAFDSTCFDLGICHLPTDALDEAAARPCDEDGKNCAHGTAVAAVAARHEPTPGVAPDASVYAIQVFDPTGGNADFVDILAALGHVADLADAGMDIAAVNLSLSSSATFPGHCDTGSAADPDAVTFRQAFAQLELRGIPSVVATGNAGATGGIGLPSCVSNAVAVTASDLDDQIADFSNRGPAVELAAPGADEGNGSINPLDIPGNPFTSQWAGTSFAAPHVSGAFALVRDEYPKASVRQLLTHLRSTGAPTDDLLTTASYPRLRLRTPSAALPAGVLFPADAVAAGTARGAVGDFDGDGFDDVLAHAPGGAPDRIAYGTDRWALQSKTYPVAGSYIPLIGNFAEGDADDILWYAPGTAADRLWIGRPSRSFGSMAVSVAGSYFPLIGDFDGDGYDDIAWYGPGANKDALWYGGPTGFSPSSMNVAGTYRAVVGDFDEDGDDDIVWHAPGSVADSLWRGTPTRGTFAKQQLAIGGTNVVRSGDFDGDGDDDLLLYQAGTAPDSIWRGGAGVGGGGSLGGFTPLAVTVNGTYQPSVADIDGDDRDDILWYAPGPAIDVLWFGQPSGSPTGPTLSVAGTYTALLADLDGSGGADVVWFQSSTATTPVWWSHP